MKLLSISIVLLFVQNVYSQDLNKYNHKDGLAIKGYDPVSYFEGKPEEGKDDITYHYKGLTYQFVSEANKKKFKASPDNYEPEYGGWCAYAMGNDGSKVDINPETYKIVDGKLYLFYNKFFNNTLNKWNKDETNIKKQADKNWERWITEEH